MPESMPLVLDSEAMPHVDAAQRENDIILRRLSFDAAHHGPLAVPSPRSPAPSLMRPPRSPSASPPTPSRRPSDTSLMRLSENSLLTDDAHVSVIFPLACDAGPGDDRTRLRPPRPSPRCFRPPAPATVLSVVLT